MSNERLTVILGAGATLDIGGLSTNRITNEIIKSTVKHYGYGKNRKFLNEIYSILNGYYGNRYVSNFEDILNALEILASIDRCKEPNIVKIFKPGYGAFFDVDDKSILDYDGVWIRDGMRVLYSKLHDVVRGYSEKYKPLEKDKWHSGFWKKLSDEYTLEVFTLNYDDVIEKTLPAIVTGFGNLIGDRRLYKSEIIRKAIGNRLCHLHGSIHFGTPPVGTFRNIYEGSLSDQCWYDDCVLAKKRRGGFSGSKNQAGEETISGSIITGLHKADKLLVDPYFDYYNLLGNSLSGQNRLLVIGYSGGDYHINGWLEKYSRFYSTDRRVVMIDYFRGKSIPWHPDIIINKELIGEELYQLMLHLIRYGENISSFGVIPEPYISPDKAGMMFFKGFRDAAENHLDKILDHLR